MTAPNPAYDRACDALRTQAKATATAIIETRARRYATKPRDLDAIEPSLSCLSPRQLRRRIAELIGEEITAPRRWRGFGGDVPMVNLKAAMVYAERLIDIGNVRRKA